MNAERLIRMAVNMLMRHGLKRLSKGGKPDPNAQATKQKMRTLNRIRRM